MRSRGRIAGALLWTWGGLATGIVTGFVLAPFLIRHLGNTSYGIWIVIGSLVSYLSLLELGTRGAAGRNIAYFRAKDDQDGVNSVASTATVLLLGVACLVLAATYLFSFWFDKLFEIPPDQVSGVRLAFILFGATTAVNLALGVFDITLWAHQRFGVLNGIEIATDLTRLAVTLYVIGMGHGVLALAVITFLTTAAGQVAKVVACVCLVRGLRLSPRLVTRAALRLIFGYGFWNTVLYIGRLGNDQSAPLIIGGRLGVALVTPFSIAQRLVSYANTVSMKSAEVFIPTAATLHAQDDRPRQQRLFLEGGRYSLILALFFLPVYLCLGRPFIALWIGPGFELAALLLVIVALGEVIPMSQHLSRAVILGMGRPRMLALINLVESMTAIALALVVAGPFGLIGIAVAYAVCGAVGRGLVQVVLVCRVIEVPVRTYLTQAVAPAVAVMVVPAAVLTLLTSWRTPANWAELIAFGAGYGACYLLAAGALLLGPRRLAGGGAAVLHRLRGAPR
jgi:O-antigen/teichoic acid export membrane protein